MSSFSLSDLHPNNLNKALVKATFSDALAAEFLKDIFRDLQEGLIMSEILEDMVLLPNQAISMCAKDVLIGVKQGRTFSSCCDGWFNPALVSALSVAERSDNFAEIGLQVLETLLDTASSMTSTIIIKLGVPILYISAILAFIVYMKGKFFPVLIKLIPPEKWSDDTNRVYFIGQMVDQYWYLMLAFIIFLFFTIKFILANWAGETRRLIDKFPIIQVYCFSQGSRILMQLGILMKAGDSIRHSVIDVMSREKPYVRWYLQRVIERIDSGYPASRAMDVGMFSSREIVGLRRREKQRAFAEAIIEISRRSVEERVNRINTLINIPMLMLYTIMAFLMFTTFSGMRVEL